MPLAISRRGLLTTAALSTLAAPAVLPTAPALAAPTAFADVPSTSQFAREIQWMFDQKISTGWVEGGKRYYRPLANTNRDAMAASFYRLAGQPPFRYSLEPGYMSETYSDVDVRTTKFYKEICWLTEAQISTGWPDGTFRPTAPIKRDAMAAFMYRFAGEPGFRAPSRSPFRDITPRTQFYKEICWLAKKGISTGWPDGTFRPLQNVARDAMAAFMYRLSALGYPGIASDVWVGLDCGPDEAVTYFQEDGWTYEEALRHARGSGCGFFG